MDEDRYRKRAQVRDGAGKDKTRREWLTYESGEMDPENYGVHLTGGGRATMPAVLAIRCMNPTPPTRSKKIFQTLEELWPDLTCETSMSQISKPFSLLAE